MFQAKKWHVVICILVAIVLESARWRSANHVDQENDVDRHLQLTLWAPRTVLVVEQVMGKGSSRYKAQNLSTTRKQHDRIKASNKFLPMQMRLY